MIGVSQVTLIVQSKRCPLQRLLYDLLVGQSQFCSECTFKAGGGGGGGWVGGGGDFVWGQIWHTSNIGAGPSDTGNFNTPNCQKTRPFLHSNQTRKHSPRRPTSHTQGSKMNGRDEQTNCRQQRNNAWLPRPERTHKQHKVPQIAQKIKLSGQFQASALAAAKLANEPQR